MVARLRPMRLRTPGSIGIGSPRWRTPLAICSSSAATGIGDGCAADSRSRCSTSGLSGRRTVVRARPGGAVGGAVGSRADRGDAGERFRMVARRGRRVVGRVEEHGADPCRAWDGEVAGGDGGDVMTIDEQLREIARHADQHQHVITAEEIVQRDVASTHWFVDDTFSIHRPAARSQRPARSGQRRRGDDARCRDPDPDPD